MNYTLHQFKIFQKVVEYSSVYKAAEELYMTQPAVSIQLKKFQEQFKFPLFELKGRRITITEYGKKIYEIVCEILEKTHQLQYNYQELDNTISGKLTIASASTGMYVIPYFVSEFLNQYPNIEIKLDFTNRKQAIASLRNKEVELAVVSLLPDTFEVFEEILLENELIMVCKKNTDPKSLPYLFREKGSATRRMMEKYFLQYGLPLETKRKIELSSNEAVKQAVLAGMGISILPKMSIQKELENQTLQIIKKKGLPIVTHWRIIYLKNRNLSPVTQTFIQFIRLNKLRIIKKYFR